MARPLKPLIRGGGGYYPSAEYTPLVYSGGFATADSTGGGNLDPLNTFTGDVIQFASSNSLPVVSISADINFEQSGTGDPSPTNIRPITGFADFTATLTDEEDEIQSVAVDWQSEEGMIYGGEVTVNEDGSADLRVTWRGTEMFGFAWTYNSSSGCFESNGLGSIDNSIGKITIGCSMYKPSANRLTLSDLSICLNETLTFPRRTYYTVKDNSCSGNVTTFENKIETNGFVTFKLSTPKTYHFDSVGQLITAIGVNTIQANTGTITVKAYGSPVV